MMPGDDFTLDLDDLPEDFLVDPGLPDGTLVDDPFTVVDDPYGPTPDGPACDVDPVVPADYIGEPPMDAMTHWHLQESPDTCAVAAQEFVLDDITGVDHSEAELVSIAEANGWYTPGGGTAPDDVGKLLDCFGVPTETQHGASVDDLAAALAEGKHVIVGVDSGELAHPGGYDPDDPLDQYPGIPGQGADHAVQVIGIDNSDPANPMVVLNDPGRPDGQGGGVPLSIFAEAWEDSGNLLVTAWRSDDVAV